jgi:hypothetical protein
LGRGNAIIRRLARKRGEEQNEEIVSVYGLR